ncbi:MAG: isoprenyl transferase [Pseudomonadota bacterium]
MSQADQSNQEPLAPAALPRHVAIIMDGNGRWAQERGHSRVRGHEEGAESVRKVVEEARRLGLSYLTLYAFSEENWARPGAEVTALMKLLKRFLKSERPTMLRQGIRLNAIGELERLPAGTRDELVKTMRETAVGQDMVLTLALSYGGRQEILFAARRLCAEAAAGRLDPAELTEADLGARLFTHDMPDPDLVIRTSGEKRISNFLLWQIAYAEFIFTPLMWPDFREAQLRAALSEYAGRQRRFGKTGEQVAGPAAHGRCRG